MAYIVNEWVLNMTNGLTEKAVMVSMIPIILMDITIKVIMGNIAPFPSDQSKP